MTSLTNNMVFLVVENSKNFVLQLCSMKYWYFINLLPEVANIYITIALWMCTLWSLLVLVNNQSTLLSKYGHLWLKPSSHLDKVSNMAFCRFKPSKGLVCLYVIQSRSLLGSKEVNFMTV